MRLTSWEGSGCKEHEAAACAVTRRHADDLMQRKSSSSSAVVLASRDIHLKKTRLKSLVSWANKFTWTYFLSALFSREEEGMMGGKADKHLPPNASDHLPYCCSDGARDW